MGVVPNVTPAVERRVAITEAALTLAAAGGNRAVTHTGIDRALDLPKGSTSYYFRTRATLLEATVVHLTEISRTAFADRNEAAPAPTVGAYLHHLLTVRMRDVRARFALAPDAAGSPQLRAQLSTCLFSPTAARDLYVSLHAPNPEAAAADLLVVCEGIVATAYFTGTIPQLVEVTATVKRLAADPPQ